MSTLASVRSCGATFLTSSALSRWGGVTPKTPFTGPWRPWMMIRSPASCWVVTPPSAVRKRNPFSSMYCTMKPISSQWPSIITRTLARGLTPTRRLPWVSIATCRA